MPFNGAQTGADAISAVREAIQMYMGLRSERAERERRDMAESRAGRALALQEQQHQLERTQADQAQQERDRNQIEFMVDRFGGQRAAPDAIATGKRVGYQSAFEPEMTLPGRTVGMPTMPFGQGPQMQAGTMPQAPTGEQLFRMPESEKSRIAAYNAQTRAFEGDANRTNQMNIAKLREEGRRAQIRSAMNNTQAMTAMMKYGIDVRDATQRMQLENSLYNLLSQADDRSFDNAMSGGILGMVMRMQQNNGQLPQPPAPPQAPNYFGPPAGGGDQWRVR